MSSDEGREKGLVDGIRRLADGATPPGLRLRHRLPRRFPAPSSQLPAPSS